jgi:hypothetical protein
MYPVIPEFFGFTPPVFHSVSAVYSWLSSETIPFEAAVSMPQEKGIVSDAVQTKYPSDETLLDKIHMDSVKSEVSPTLNYHAMKPCMGYWRHSSRHP